MQERILTNEKSHFAIGLVPQSKRLEYGLELTRILQLKIDSLCRENNADFSIFYTLNHEQTELIEERKQVCQRIDSLYYFYSEYEVLNRQRELNKEFRTFEIPVLSDNWTVGKYDGHLNPDANRQVIESLADSLIQIVD